MRYRAFCVCIAAVVTACGAAVPFEASTVPSSDKELCQSIHAFQKVMPRNVNEHLEAFDVMFEWMDFQREQLKGTDQGEMLNNYQMLLEAGTPGNREQIEMPPEELRELADAAAKGFTDMCVGHDTPPNDLYKQVYAHVLSESNLEPYTIGSVEPEL